MNGTPYSFVDGIVRFVGAAGSGTGKSCSTGTQASVFEWWQGGFDERKDLPAPLTLSLSSAYDPSTLSGQLTVHAKLDNQMAPPAHSSNKIIVVLFEKQLPHSDSSGDSVIFPQVERAEILFQDFTSTQAGDEATFNVDFKLDPAWVAENMGAIAFVQNFDTSYGSSMDQLMAKEIYNTGILGNLNSPPAAGHLRPLSKP